MPGLGKGLTKSAWGDQELTNEEQAAEFIQGARQRTEPSALPAKRTRTRKFIRCTFSLTEAISTSIDRLSLLPRTFHCNRSEVIKAAIELLETMPEEQVVELLKQAKHL